MSDKKVICYHHNDTDGKMSAAIVKSVYSDAVFVEVNYGDDFKLNYKKYNTIIVVDFSFERKIMDEMIAHADVFCWIDHHETAKKDMPDLWQSDKICGLREIGKSGAMLAWKWFYNNSDIPDAVLYTNDYDLWKLELLPMSQYFNERMFLESFTKIWVDILNNTYLHNTVMTEGKILWDAKLRRVKKVIKKAAS